MLNIIAILFLLFISGCMAVGEDYEKPKDFLNKENWHSIDKEKNKNTEELSISKNVKTLKWWQNFNDDKVAELVEKSLIYNHDIKTAKARIKEAVANHNAAFATLLPQIDGVGSLKREQLGAISNQRLDQTSDVGVRGTWDLDIFGGNKRRKEAALANVELAETQAKSIKIAIASEVARNYMSLKQTHKQKELILKNIKIQQETLEGTIEKRKVGSVTELEVTRAEAQVEETKLRLVQIDTDINIILNRLNVLTGEELNSLTKILDEQDIIPSIEDDIIISTPFQVINTHPDIMAAERDLASRTALTGAAFAEMFPKISIGGFFGVNESNSFGGATPWNIAGNLVTPILHFGSLKSQLNAADARQQQVFESYKQTVLLTIEEIENSVISYYNEKQRLQKLTSILQKRKKVVDIAKEQYKAGVITQLDLLLAQQNQLDAENNSAISEASIAKNAINLYESFGMLEEDKSDEI